MITTVYCIDVLVGDHDRARGRHERRRGVRRRAFSTRGNFLATYIRHRPWLRVLARDQRTLVRGVVAAAFVAPLVLGIGAPPDRGLRALATLVAAVALPPIVRPADDEQLGAVAAGQREDIELVHPARMVENWTATSETTTVRTYWLVHPSLVPRAQVWRPGPSPFPPRLELSERRPVLRHFSNRVVPWSPVISVEVVPYEVGGDTPHSPAATPDHDA
jgi:hypothetical protein